jgi:cell filamentation protein
LAEVVDPYLDPDTGLLRNLVGARTQGALDQAEGDLTYIRAAELQERPVRATGDLDEFRAIHRQLFQDVYPWAGEVRTVDLRKNVAGAEHFLSVGAIDRGSMFAADELRADNMLRGMNRDQFIERLSHHYDQWNYVHPFREGNGRTQRVFWNRVAADAGWQLDWRPVQGAVNDAACRAAAESRDFGPMRAMFDQVVSRGGSLADTTSALDRFALRTSLSIDQAMDVARIVGMDQPTRPTATPPSGPSAPEAFGASVYRPSQGDRGLGR